MRDTPDRAADGRGSTSDDSSTRVHSWDAPPEMVALAHAWRETHELLEPYRRDMETLPKSIANIQSKRDSRGNLIYTHPKFVADIQRRLEIAKASVPQLEAQLRALEEKYHELGYDDVEYSAGTPSETIIGGRGIAEVGDAIHAGGSGAGLRPTGDEELVAATAVGVFKLGQWALKKTLGKALIKAARGIPKPSVSDPKLRNITEDLYKGVKTTKPIGSGSTADAIRHELKTGQATFRRFHSQKGREYARALEKWLQKNPNASAPDRAAARQMLEDIQKALEGN